MKGRGWAELFCESQNRKNETSKNGDFVKICHQRGVGRLFFLSFCQKLYRNFRAGMALIWHLHVGLQIHKFQNFLATNSLLACLSGTPIWKFCIQKKATFFTRRLERHSGGANFELAPKFFYPGQHWGNPTDLLCTSSPQNR